MTPTARRQAERQGARWGCIYASWHAKGHLGEINRAIKRVRSNEAADFILDGCLFGVWSARWRSVVRRAFQRRAIGLLRRAASAPPDQGGDT